MEACDSARLHFGGDVSDVALGRPSLEMHCAILAAWLYFTWDMRYTYVWKTTSRRENDAAIIENQFTDILPLFLSLKFEEPVTQWLACRSYMLGPPPYGQCGYAKVEGSTPSRLRALYFLCSFGFWDSECSFGNHYEIIMEPRCLQAQMWGGTSRRSFQRGTRELRAQGSLLLFFPMGFATPSVVLTIST